MTGWLLDTLLATSGLALLVLLLREPVRNRFGSRVTYGLWLIPAARLFMPTLTRTVERRVTADPLTIAPISIAKAAAPQPSLIEQLGGWPALLLAIWIAVAAGLFVSRVIAYHRDRRAILASSVEIGRAGSVRIIRSPEVASPIALGIFDRLILVPEAFERLYGPRERRLVLDHELAHHGSGDLVANLFAFVLLCLQWFNPLAWAAHAAFRFDQEAACDARVLDKVAAGDRAAYGRAIAKAASGRAPLFASALGRPNSLHRRLKSMLNSTKPSHRIAGRIMILAGIAVALPLTASRAVEYINVPAEPAVHSTAALPALAPVAAAAAIQAAPVESAAPAGALAPPAPPAPDIQPDRNMTISGDLITIDGQTKRWEDLTPAEKAEVREAVTKARSALENVHIDRDKLMRAVASIPDKAQLEKMQRDLARTQENVGETLRQLSQQSDELRAAGQEPSQIEATVANALKSVQGIDMHAIAREVGSIDQRKIAQSVSGAEDSVRRAKAELDRMQARMDADRRQ